MPEARYCSQCGSALTGGEPIGLCARCLLWRGIEGHTAGYSQSAPHAKDWQSPTPAELAGQFADVEVVELIGRGGMAAVYKARQNHLDRIVALKILPPGISDDAASGFAERFSREAKMLARLNHPNIVTLYESGETGSGLYYFLMEYVDGVNLRRLIDNGRLAPREALAIVPQVCDALQYAHDMGIVHRDIKPENILLDRQGRVKVADFGLAKIVGQSEPTGNQQANSARASGITEAGRIVGTPSYMAPEQFTRPAAVDHRADIYALGVVFYQMLTGELPSGPIEPPSRKVQIDIRLDEVVLRALDANPAQRFSQASVMKTQVEVIAAAAVQPTAARRADVSRVSLKAVVKFFIVVALTITLIAVLEKRNSRGRASRTLGSSPTILFGHSTDLVKLPSGMSVELLGICQNTPGTQTWWKSDGSPMPNAPFPAAANLVRIEPENVARQVVLRLGHAPPDISVTCQTDPPSPSNAIYPPEIGKQTISDLRAIDLSLPRSATNFSLRIGIAAGPWTTVADCDSGGNQAGESTQGLKKIEYSFGVAADAGSGAAITVTFGVGSDNCRLVAEGTDGQIHVGESHAFMAVGTLTQTSVTFPGLRLGQIRKFKLQTRPYEYAGFRCVAMYPRAPGLRVDSSPALARSSTTNSDAVQDRAWALYRSALAAEGREQWKVAIADYQQIMQLPQSVQPTDIRERMENDQWQILLSATQP